MYVCMFICMYVRVYACMYVCMYVCMYARMYVAYISNLTRPSYFQVRRLRTIGKAVSVPVFTSIVHAFVCSRIDYCNSLLIGLPKTQLSPLQTERSCTTHCQTSPLLPYLLLHQGTSPLASNLSPCAANSSSS